MGKRERREREKKRGGDGVSKRTEPNVSEQERGRRENKKTRAPPLGLFQLFLFCCCWFRKRDQEGDDFFRVFVGVTGAENNSLQKKKKKERASFVSFKVEFVFVF